MTKHIHGGDVYKYDHCLDFSANCNPLGTPKSVKQAIIDSVEDLSDYPRVGCGPLKEAIADYEHTKKEYLICGNGAADLIFSLSRALNPKKALLPAPTFAEYEQALVSVGCEISRYYLKEENDFCIQKDYPDVLKREKPDIILMDIRMPTMDGVECTKIVKEKYPEIKIIVLTTFDDDKYVFSALKYGASGYLLKGISVDELEKAIHVVYGGGAMINPEIASKVVELFSEMAQQNYDVMIEAENVEKINDMEWDIIKDVGHGMSNKEIADHIGLTEGTVRNYISTILKKIGLRDRSQLAIWEVQSGAQKRRG